MEKFKTQIPVKYGIISFAFVLTVGLLMYVFYQSVVSSFFLFGAIQLLSFGVILFLGIWAGITYRRENEGVISFGTALLAIYIVFAFNVLGYDSSIILVNKVIDRQYAEKASSLLKEKMADYFDSHNMPEDKAKEAMQNMGPEKFNPPFTELLKSSAYALAFYFVIALIIALFIKRGSSDLTNISAQ